VATDIQKMVMNAHLLQVQHLYVGESPPAHGTFFYAGKTAMGTFTQRVYEAVYGRTFADQQAFLRYFCDTGAFLDDLSGVPVDQVTRAQRHRMLRASIPDFTTRLQTYHPERIICILRSIAPYVQLSIAQAGLVVPFDVLPFPGCGWQRVYMDGLARILREHVSNIGDRCENRMARETAIAYQITSVISSVESKA
jgi:hypothetical protein